MYIPIIKNILPTLLPSVFMDKLLSIQPLAEQPTGVVFPMDYVCRGFYNNMFEELWLEDGGYREDEAYDIELYHCPQTANDDFISNYEFEQMKLKELVFEKWEIEQQERFVEGLGNMNKPKKTTLLLNEQDLQNSRGMAVIG